MILNLERLRIFLVLFFTLKKIMSFMNFGMSEVGRKGWLWGIRVPVLHLAGAANGQ